MFAVSRTFLADAANKTKHWILQTLWVSCGQHSQSWYCVWCHSDCVSVHSYSTFCHICFFGRVENFNLPPHCTGIGKATRQRYAVYGEACRESCNSLTGGWIFLSQNKVAFDYFLSSNYKPEWLFSPNKNVSCILDDASVAGNEISYLEVQDSMARLVVRLLWDCSEHVTFTLRLSRILQNILFLVFFVPVEIFKALL